VSSSPAISVRGLVKRYPHIRNYKELFLHPFHRSFLTALDGIDLEVAPGRCFCLLGPNGAGKTTLIKILCTIVLADSGQAFVDGIDAARDPDKIKPRIGFAIGEERSFYWRLTGRQNLEFFAALNNIPPSEARRRIGELLRLTDLENAADSRFNTYSTGMRQMLAFARALLTDARILFVDEPTRSLDPRSADKIRSFIKNELVGRQGKTAFWATHNLAETADVADDLAILDKGRVRVAGPLAEVTKGGTISLRDIFYGAVGETVEDGTSEELGRDR
jgi:ABC-2 type transport system ATP-binding protein